MCEPASLPIELSRPLLACAEGRLPPNVALAQLITMAETPDAVDAAIRAAHQVENADQSGHLEALAALWRDTPSAWSTVRRVASSARHDAPAESCERWADVFDQDMQIRQRALVHAVRKAGLRERAGRAERQLASIVGGDNRVWPGKDGRAHVRAPEGIDRRASRWSLQQRRWKVMDRGTWR